VCAAYKNVRKSVPRGVHILCTLIFTDGQPEILRLFNFTILSYSRKYITRKICFIVCCLLCALCQLDIVIDNVASTVLILEAVQSSMSKMSATELGSFQLDANLGGTSAVLQRKSVERLPYYYCLRHDAQIDFIKMCGDVYESGLADYQVITIWMGDRLRGVFTCVGWQATL